MSSPRSLLVIVPVAGALSICACGDGTSGPSDATTADAKTVDVSPPDITLPDTNPMAYVNPECDVPPEAGSGGSCASVGGDAGFECNPVTGAPCDGDAGEACDYYGTTFRCYPPPPSNTSLVCARCDDNAGPACAPTNTCVPVADGGKACARFCCDVNDCGQGHCEIPAGQVVGVCLQ